MYRISLTFILLSTFLVSFKQHLAPALAKAVVLEGVVTDEEKKPLQKVLVFTVLGEEEAITDRQGRFSFKTGQPLPIRLVVRMQDYEEKVVELTTPPGRLEIELKRK